MCEDNNYSLAQKWCVQRGDSWNVTSLLGLGGTAPVFELESPYGSCALKVYDADFSSGDKGEIESRRIEQQLELRNHNCPFLVQVYEAGSFDGRLYVLMSRAPGQELEKVLQEVPRNKVRQIVDQVARAALFLKSRNLCHRDIKSANVFISEDFELATLLDVSVVRDIHDPIGVGTDHDDQLPIVATARYSPPEYLFRLLEPGPQLWHALNIYQLGALLHDLIIKKPLFQAEYNQSATNRYRFAWLVATAIPDVRASDIEQDLVLTAQRALDKDWEQRSTLELEDFLADTVVQQKQALGFLGLGSDKSRRTRITDISERLKRITSVASQVDEGVAEWLRIKGATAEHRILIGEDDYTKVLKFRWNTRIEEAPSPTSIVLTVTLRLVTHYGNYWFKGSAEVLANFEGSYRQASLPLPSVADEQGIESYIINQVGSLLSVLAVKVSNPEQPTGE
jgi:serine/threonine protein kinase